jgi:hypothetical protein
MFLATQLKTKYTNLAIFTFFSPHFFFNIFIFISLFGEISPVKKALGRGGGGEPSVFKPKW